MFHTGDPSCPAHTSSDIAGRYLAHPEIEPRALEFMAWTYV